CHAQVWWENGSYFVEDLGSANGTLLNGHRIAGPKPLKDGDRLTLCNFVLGFQADPEPESATGAIREQVDALVSNADLFADNPQQKLQTVLQLAQNLGQTLELQPLLDKLLENLLQLFPLADRGLIVLCEGNRLVVRAQRKRRKGDADISYSRTVIRTA